MIGFLSKILCLTIKDDCTRADRTDQHFDRSIGIKIDAIPGRLNEAWFEAEETGTFYGQCSELCGRLHGFMPIAVKVVTKEEFAAWVERAKEEFARADGPVDVACRLVCDWSIGDDQIDRFVDLVAG